MSEIGAESSKTCEESKPRDRAAIFALDELWTEISQLGNQLINLEKELDIVLNPSTHNVSDEMVPPLDPGTNEISNSTLTNRIRVLKAEVHGMRNLVTSIVKRLEL